MTTAKKRSTIRKKLLLLGATLVVTLVLAELVLSAASRLFYPRMIVRDPVLGWKYEPTKEPVKRRFVVLGGEDQTYHLTINTEGFRDDEFVDDPDSLKIGGLLPSAHSVPPIQFCRNRFLIEQNQCLTSIFKGLDNSTSVSIATRRQQ